MSISMKSLDERIDDLAENFTAARVDAAAFQARVDTQLSIIKYIAGTATAVLIGAVGYLMFVSNQAGKLETAIRTSETSSKENRDALTEQGKTLAAITEQIKALTTATQKNEAAIAALTDATRKNEAAIAVLAEQVKALTVAVQKNEAAIAELTKVTQQVARDVAELKAKGKP